MCFRSECITYTHTHTHTAKHLATIAVHVPPMTAEPTGTKNSQPRVERCVCVCVELQFHSSPLLSARVIIFLHCVCACILYVFVRLRSGRRLCLRSPTSHTHSINKKRLFFVGPRMGFVWVLCAVASRSRVYTHAHTICTHTPVRPAESIGFSLLSLGLAWWHCTPAHTSARSPEKRIHREEEGASVASATVFLYYLYSLESCVWNVWPILTRNTQTNNAPICVCTHTFGACASKSRARDAMIFTPPRARSIRTKKVPCVRAVHTHLCSNALLYMNIG